MNKISAQNISLPVEGMTCASCVARVEKTVTKINGISNVNVNLATEKVTFDYDPAMVKLDEVAAKVEDIGYKLDLSKLKEDEENSSENNLKSDKQLSELRNDLIFAIVLTIPITLINMGMMWKDFFLNDYLNPHQINKLLLVFTTPVVFISGRRFYKIFWSNLKHFTADMN